MPKRDRQHAATSDRIAALPCFDGQGVTVQTTGEVTKELSLGEGRTNQNFIVTTGDATKYFVRVGGDLPHHAVVRDRERAVQRAAAAQGLAPEVVYASDDIMVMSFVNGKALTEAQMHRAAGEGVGSPLLTAITATIRKLHKTPPPRELLTGAAAGWGGPHLPQWIAYATNGGYKRLPILSDAAHLMPILEAAAGELAPPALCHFDLLPDNFVVSGDGEPSITIVDYEYTGLGQPLMDLAVLSMGCDLSTEEDAALLASYLELPEITPEVARAFLALKVLAALRETFWGVVAEVSHASALSDAEAAAYTDLNYGKLMMLRAMFNFERWERAEASTSTSV